MLGSISSALLCLTHYYSLFIVVPWLYMLTREKNFRHLGYFCGASFLTFMPYILWIMSDFQTFYNQVVVARNMDSVSIGVRFSEIINYFFVNKRTVNIVVAFVIGSAMLLFNIRRYNSFLQRTVLVIPYLFLIQFFISPRYSYIYTIAILPFVYLPFFWIINDKNRKYVLTLLSFLLLLNMAGVFAIIYKYKNFNYQAYKEQFHEVMKITPETRVLGRTSMYPIFANAQFKAYEAFELLVDRRQTLIDTIDGVDYVIVDDFTRDNVGGNRPVGNVVLDEYLVKYIESHMHEHASFTNKYYGSEGLKRENLITIYSK